VYFFPRGRLPYYLIRELRRNEVYKGSLLREFLNTLGSRQEFVDE
jgi:hypothetical protein